MNIRTGFSIKVVSRTPLDLPNADLAKLPADEEVIIESLTIEYTTIRTIFFNRPMWIWQFCVQLPPSMVTGLNGSHPSDVICW